MKIQQILVIKFISTKIKLLAFFSKRKAAEKIFELFCTPFGKQGKNVPALFSTAESISLQLNGKKINGYCWNRGKGKRVMILHGFSSSAYKFHSYIGVLADKGFEVVAFNAPAHGNSEGKTVNVVEYSELIQAVIKKVGMPDGFIAHSFGGIALSLALENIPHSNKTKVVLIAPATETTTAAEGAFKILHIKSSAVKAAFNNVILEKSGRTTAWFSIRRAMNQIEAAVLWVHDENDDITPLQDVLKVKEDNHPNIDFIITKGLGHRNIYRSNEVKKQVFDFLSFT